MTARTPSCRNVLVCLFVFLLTGCAARRKPVKSEVPPTTVDKDGCKCVWTPWMNNDDFNVQYGDDTTYDNLRHLYNFCEKPKNIKCRDTYLWHVPYNILSLENTVCDVKTGLKCTSKPYSKIKSSAEKPYYCHDFEITVQCCVCQTTTVQPETTTAAAVTTGAEPGHLIDMQKSFFPDSDDLQLRNVKSNGTNGGEKGATDGNFSVSVIVIVVCGFLAILIFIAAIFFVLMNGTFGTRRVPEHNRYEEAPKEDITSASEVHNVSKAPVSFLLPSRSSDYITTSSEDEGYRSRPSYNRKRRTRSERDRKLRNNGNKHSEWASDSLECPTLDSKSAAEGTSEDGKDRKWFPDEYERALEEKQRRRQSSKTRLLFGAQFGAMNRKSITHVDSEP